MGLNNSVRYLFALIVAWHLSGSHIYIFPLLFMVISLSIGLTYTSTFLTREAVFSILILPLSVPVCFQHRI